MVFNKTVNIHSGRKLAGKTRAEIADAVLNRFGNGVQAIQQCLDAIRVTFQTEEGALAALKEKGCRLFGLWLKMDGGPPVTIVHLFDYPFEEDDEGAIAEFFGQYGQVYGVRQQTYINHELVYTGTRLVDVFLRKTPPRMVSINARICRVWFNGQPIICNLCGAQGHKYSECPDKDKCRLCKQVGHKARECTNAWGTAPPAAEPQGSEPMNSEPSNVSSDPAPGESRVDDPPSDSNESPDSVDPPSVSEAVPARDIDNATLPASSVESGGAQPSSDDNVFSSQESSNVSPPVSQAEPGISQSSVDIGDFTSSVPSSQDPISDFSDDSQSILQNNVNLEAPAASDGVSPPESASQSDEMDTSVTRKRKDLSDDESSPDPSPVVEVPPEYRRKRQSQSGTPPSGISASPGMHSGLPRIVPDRPPR